LLLNGSSGFYRSTIFLLAKGEFLQDFFALRQCTSNLFTAFCIRLGLNNRRKEGQKSYSDAPSPLFAHGRNAMQFFGID
jgi:hypothetical protein